MTSEPAEVVAARYLAEACHELRTPSAVLSLVSDLGPHAHELSPERMAAVMTTIRSQTALLRTLIDRYFEHGVLVDGAWSGVDANVDVGLEAATALDSLIVLIPAERIRRQLAEGPIFGDPARVRSIVVNLVLNAVKYSPVSEPVDVQVRREASDVALRIIDRGMGIPASERDQVLKSFVRGANAKAQAVAGAGLGLAIVAAHVDALGGSVQMSDRPGGGTIVTVLLPTSPGAAHGR